jgi:hypothetical protein
MSKSVKMIVGVVAAVAIPFAAPALAAAVMGSTALGGALAAGATTLGMTGTSAVIGAGLGAASAAATGGDIGRGALFGGLGGGLGGLAKAGQAATAAQGASQGAATTQQGFNAATSAQGLATDAAAGLAPQGFSGGAVDATVAGLSSGMQGAGAATAPGAMAGLGTSAPALAESAQAGLTTGVQPTAATTWGGRFKEGISQGWDKITAPENVSNMALEGGKYLAGSYAAGSGMTSAEEAMMRAQRQEMKRAQEANDAIFNTRRDEALKLINEANYYDPEYMGLQRARQEQLRGARAKQAGLRGLNTPARTAEARRYDLGTSRATGAAYDQGYQSGVQQRTATRAAGLAALPPGYQTTTADYVALGGRMDQAEERRRTRARDIGNLFGDFSGTRKSEELGG